MANSFDKNTSNIIAKNVAEAFECERVLSKNVDTALFRGKFTPDTGSTYRMKRPTDYVALETADGDITGQQQDIITADITAYVQPVITIPVEYSTVEQALEMGTDSDRFWKDMARRIVTKLELNLARFALQNLGLVSGTLGNAVNSYEDVAYAGALMDSIGIPKADRCYFIDPYAQRALSIEQRSLGVNPEVKTANEMATIARNFASFDLMTATTQTAFSTGVGADRAGTLSANPDVTYATNKDTMQQTLAVTGFQANLVVAAGENITISGRNRLNQATREIFTDETGSEVEFTATVAETVTLDGSGAGNIVINGPAIFEASGAYNTVESAPVSGDVVTLSGAASTRYQPNLFWHRQALSMTTVPMERLHSTDTFYNSEDGLQLRVSKYADGDRNRNKLRLDLHPAFCCVNPSFGGQSHGIS